MIDSHFHLWTEDESTPEKRAERAGQIREQMEAAGVDRISLIGEVGNTVEECHRYNRTVAKYVEEYPDLFYGWARVDPRLDGAVEEFRRAVQEDGLVGLKHHFYGSPVKCSDEEFFPLAEAAVDMDVPMIVHVLERLEQDRRNPKESFTEDVVELCERYPDLTFVSAHIAGGGDWEYRIKNVEDVDNVYLDVSGSVTDAGLIEMAAERLGTDRLVFGTDTWFLPGVGKLEGCRLTPEEKADVAYNFEHLLGDNVRNRYDPDELAERKAQAVERFEEAQKPREETIVDANAFVGQWPFRDLDADPEDLLDVMDRKGIDRALVSSIEGVVLRNVHAGNRKLAERVEDHDRLVPVATIDPTYAAWRKDLRECVEELGMQAVKLFPAYHDYDLNAPEAKELLDECAALDVPVIVVATLEDQRQRHPRTELRHFEGPGRDKYWRESEGKIDDLVELLLDCPETDVILADTWSNAARVEAETTTVQNAGVRLDNGVRSGRTLFVAEDLFMYFLHQGEAIVEEIGVDNLVCGSKLPFRVFEAHHGTTERLPVSEAEKNKIRSGNLLELLSD